MSKKNNAKNTGSGKDKAEAEEGASYEDMADEPSFTEITLDVPGDDGRSSSFASRF